MARVFAVRVQILFSAGAVAVQVDLMATKLSRCTKPVNEHWRSVAVQFWSETEICPDAGFNLHAEAGVRVQLAVPI
jgi:hypothetical protein